jgi:hypothetical protein
MNLINQNLINLQFQVENDLTLPKSQEPIYTILLPHLLPHLWLLLQYN